MALSSEQQATIYDQLVKLVKDNITDEFNVHEAPGRIEVNTQKEVIIADRKRPFLNLLSVIIQKHHVGFYYMPVYVEQSIKDGLSSTVAKMLKGKSCFHCKTELSIDQQDEFAQLVRIGVQLYREKGWI